MDVLHQGRDVGKRRGVGDGPTVGIKTPLPARVDIDVVEAVRLQPRSLKQLRSGDVLTIEERDALLKDLEV